MHLQPPPIHPIVLPRGAPNEGGSQPEREPGWEDGNEEPDGPVPEGTLVRAMILAAGLGTRMRPFSELRAKPALPVRGRPVISLLLQFLAAQGCRQVMVNLHHRPESIRAAVASDCPPDLDITWSEEPMPLGTGGGIRRASDFLAEDEACVVIAGDMLLDLDLAGHFEAHRASGREVTLLLHDDPRDGDFGTIGVDANGGLCRIGSRVVDRAHPEDHSPETARGLFTGVRFFSRRALENPPRETVFEDLRDWILPAVEAGALSVGAERIEADQIVWEPVGTPAEYLHANLSPPSLPSLGGTVRHWEGDIEIRGRDRDVIISRKARVSVDTDLARCVVWDGEEIPAGFRGHDGVFAGGRFRSCLGDPEASEESRSRH